MESITKGIEKWKNEDVINYLKENNLEIYAHKFKEHRINGKDFLSLTSDELKLDLDIKNLHIRKKLLREIQKLKQSTIEYIHVKVMYFAKEAKFKVFDLQTFTLRDLLMDCINCYQIDNVLLY